MAGVNVQLLGTERDALQAWNIDGPENLPGVWRFVSDARGRCTVHLGCFKGFDSQRLVGKSAPGWGRFYFIAEAGHLRGVSLGIIHEPEGKLAKDSYDYEWNRHGVVKTSDNPIVTTLRMERGLRLSGRVIDTTGQPVRDFEINVQHDLGSESHTGYGNEIFRHSTSTDREGRFVLSDIFPNTFYLKEPLREETLPVWVHTKLHGKWRAEALDKITPGRGEKTIRMTLVVSHELPYRYLGQVRDETGKPIPDASVALGVSRHRDMRTYEDSHTFLHTTVDDNGRFKFRTATPFIRYVNIEAPGFASHEEDYEEKGMKAPGQWSITLRRPKE